MADDRLNEAIDIVTRYVIARAVEDWTSAEAWATFSVLDEELWRAVAVRATSLIPARPDKEQYEAAYDYLTQGVEP